MKTLFLALTAGVLTMGAATTQARADWDDVRPGVVMRVAPPPRPYYVAPAPVVTYAPAPVYTPAYVSPWSYWQHEAWERWHRWHEWREHHGYGYGYDHDRW